MICGSSLGRQAPVFHLEYPFAIAGHACFLGDMDLVVENHVTFILGSSIFQITVVMKFYVASNLRIKLSSDSFELMNQTLYLIFMVATGM